MKKTQSSLDIPFKSPTDLYNIYIYIYYIYIIYIIYILYIYIIYIYICNGDQKNITFLYSVKTRIGNRTEKNNLIIIKTIMRS